MSGEIELLIDEIEAIAKQMQGYIAGHAKSSAGEFADATLDASAFNGIPPGLAFFTQQQAAHEVFVQTINGVVADLEQFGETLAANAASHRAVDESNAETLTAHDVQQDQQAAAQAMDSVNREYGEQTDRGEGLAAEEAYDESRQGNEALDVPTEQDGGAQSGHPGDGPTSTDSTTAPAGGDDAPAADSGPPPTSDSY